MPTELFTATSTTINYVNYVMPSIISLHRHTQRFT
jgi:hypothetical protein